MGTLRTFWTMFRKGTVSDHLFCAKHGITDVSNLGDFAFTLGSKTHNIRAIQLVFQKTSCTYLLPVLPLRDGGTKTKVTFPQVRRQGYHDTADK